MRLVVAVIVGFLSTSTLAFSEGFSSEGVMACSNLPEGKSYQCMNRLLKEEMAKQHPKESAQGMWTVAKTKNKFTDDPIIFAFVASDKGLNSLRKPFILSVRCAGGSLDVLMNWGAPVGQDDASKAIRYRIDTQPAKLATMQVVAGRHDLTYTTDVEGFIRPLLRGKRFLIQLFPDFGEAMDGEFDIEGISEVIKPIAAACHWTP
jgi:hypothetical protein